MSRIHHSLLLAGALLSLAACSTSRPLVHGEPAAPAPVTVATEGANDLSLIHI